MEVGLIISDKMEEYQSSLRKRLRGKNTLFFSTDTTLLKCPIVSGDVSFVAWDASICDSSIIPLFHKISQLYENVPVFLIEENNIDSARKSAIERIIQYNISDDFNIAFEMERFVEVICGLPCVDDRERQSIRKIYRNVIGESQNMEDLRLFISRVAKNQIPVMLYGEDGCGKSLVAKTIHEAFYEKNSERDGNFVIIDLKYLPEHMIETIIFGKRKIDFSDSYSIENLIEKANNGTVLIRNIDKASLLLQTKLMEVLEEKTVRRIGEKEERSLDFKLICTSKKELSNMVSENKFREDLYYKLNTQEFKIERLKDRSKDIEVLSKFYCKSHKCKLHSSAISKLRMCDWKWNVCELFSILDKAILCSERIGIVYPESIRFFD